MNTFKAPGREKQSINVVTVVINKVLNSTGLRPESVWWI